MPENEAPVADAQAILRRVDALELLHIARIRLKKSGQTLQQPQRGFAVHGSEIGTGSGEKSTRLDIPAGFFG
jgi:hypothetical protein